MYVPVFGPKRTRYTCSWPLPWWICCAQQESWRGAEESERAWGARACALSSKTKRKMGALFFKTQTDYPNRFGLLQEQINMYAFQINYYVLSISTIDRGFLFEPTSDRYQTASTFGSPVPIYTYIYISVSKTDGQAQATLQAYSTTCCLLVYSLLSFHTPCWYLSWGYEHGVPEDTMLFIPHQAN